MPPVSVTSVSALPASSGTRCIAPTSSSWGSPWRVSSPAPASSKASSASPVTPLICASPRCAGGAAVPAAAPPRARGPCAGSADGPLARRLGRRDGVRRQPSPFRGEVEHHPGHEDQAERELEQRYLWQAAHHIAQEREGV